MAGHVLRPVVHPWMLVPPEQVRSLADRLGGFADRYDLAVAQARAVLQGASTGTGGPLAVPGPTGDGVAPGPVGRASHCTAPSGHDQAFSPRPLDELRRAIRLAQEAFAGLADALEAHGPELRERLAALDEVSGESLRALRRRRREIRRLSDTLSDADVVARRRLEDAARSVPQTGEVNVAGGWVAALTDLGRLGDAPGADDGTGGSASHGEPSGNESRRGVDGADREGAGREAGPHAADGRGPDGQVDRWRRRWRHRPPGELARHLRIHPEHVGPLAAACEPAQVPELASLARGPAAPTSAHRVREVAAVFAQLSEDEARRLALLYPGVIGRLDGAPSKLRIEANRLLVREALGQARCTDVELENRAIARRVVDARRWRRRLRARVLQSWLTRDAITSFVAIDTDLPLLLRADLRIRIRLYQSLLLDRVPGPGAGDPPGHRGTPGPGAGRRLLLFDPQGRGRIAELWGADLTPARHVGVFVPGTGTAVRGFHMPTQVAADLAAADHTGATSVIAWMGADFPYSTVNQAVLPRFAHRAAVPLRDHLLGLDAPAEATRTVLGHSYGGVMVGAAERAGLACDRVVHLASPGAGPGVRGVQDYPATDPFGRPRDVRRFTLTAPGDPIRWAQAASVVWPLLRRLPWWRDTCDLGLGIDPARLHGITRLRAGVWEQDVGVHVAGEALRGPGAHAALTARGTESLRRIAEVVMAPAPPRPGGDGP